MELLNQQQKEHLLEANNKANLILEQIAHAEYTGRDELAVLLRKFIAAKMDLDPIDEDDNFIDMIRLNVARSLNVSKEELHKHDLPAKCNKTTVVNGKKILMYIAIQKRLEITLPRERLAYMQTVYDLADEILKLV